MGAYFPYMIVDVNSHGLFAGKGEHEARRYTRGQSDNKKTYYDADLYEVERDFDDLFMAKYMKKQAKEELKKSYNVSLFKRVKNMKNF